MTYMLPIAMILAASLSVLPNDPYYSEQWNLQSRGPFKSADGKGTVRGGDHAHVQEAWQLLLDNKKGARVSDLGKSVRMAIIDDGFDIKHEDLKNKVAAYKNFGGPVIEGNLFSQTPKDVHGTMVTGIAAAQTDNGVGIAGACPGCELVLARISSENFAPGRGEDYFQEVFDWVMKQDVDIINCSWGPDDDASREFFARLIEKLASEGRGGKGIILVAAVGNDGKDIQSDVLASQPSVIAVGGSNSLGQRLTFSRHGEALDLLAPIAGGEGKIGAYIDRIWTTDNFLAPPCLTEGVKPTTGCSDQAGLTPTSPMAGGDGWMGKYSYRFSHTSAAAPLVSGVVGLILTANPSLTAREVESILHESADKIEPGAARYDSEGFSPTHGYGRVNAARAVELALVK
ncbi:MAG: hypothetical protein EOP09_02705 [Proteobacteria bacterium]|nr:MAG: hypothetical protein EOP09_02705 [Pseudomonadota bacterium]